MFNTEIRKVIPGLSPDKSLIESSEMQINIHDTGFTPYI